MSDAKVMPNGRSKITPRDVRLAGLVPHGIPEADLPSNRGHARGATERDGQHPVYDRHPPRAYRPSLGGPKSNGKDNGSAPVWSHADPSVEVEGMGRRLRSGAQALGRHARGWLVKCRLYALGMARLVGQCAHWTVRYIKGDTGRGFLWVDVITGTIIAGGGLAAVLWRVM
jgi:hypothetical protein